MPVPPGSRHVQLDWVLGQAHLVLAGTVVAGILGSVFELGWHMGDWLVRFVVVVVVVVGWYDFVYSLLLLLLLLLHLLVRFVVIVVFVVVVAADVAAVAVAAVAVAVAVAAAAATAAAVADVVELGSIEAGVHDESVAAVVELVLDENVAFDVDAAFAVSVVGAVVFVVDAVGFEVDVVVVDVDVGIFVVGSKGVDQRGCAIERGFVENEAFDLLSVGWSEAFVGS